MTDISKIVNQEKHQHSMFRRHGDPDKIRCKNADKPSAEAWCDVWAREGFSTCEGCHGRYTQRIAELQDII